MMHTMAVGGGDESSSLAPRPVRIEATSWLTATVTFWAAKIAIANVSKVRQGRAKDLYVELSSNLPVAGYSTP